MEKIMSVYTKMEDGFFSFMDKIGLYNKVIEPLEKKGIKVNAELYALSILIQTIFRTRIRNFDKSDEERIINLYIPSSRMRNLLKKWLNNEIE